MVKAAVEERARTSQECNDTSRMLVQPLHLCFRKPQVRSLHLVVGFLLYKASPRDEDLAKWGSTATILFVQSERRSSRTWRSGEGGAHRAEAARCGQSGHCRMWLLSSIALRPEMGQDLLLFWCQERAVKAPSQASVTGPDGTSHAAYDTN